MPHPESEHGLRVQLATALRERDEYRTNWVSEEARRIKAESALAAARRECEVPESVKMIAAERNRQIKKEGWTPAHDDDHTDGELAAAASCYAYTNAHGYMPLHWPWSSDWWKPGKDRIRQLVKAGALIAAEIERLQRAALAPPGAAAGEEGTR